MHDEKERERERESRHNQIEMRTLIGWKQERVWTGVM